MPRILRTSARTRTAAQEEIRMLLDAGLVKVMVIRGNASQVDLEMRKALPEALKVEAELP